MNVQLSRFTYMYYPLLSVEFECTGSYSSNLYIDLHVNWRHLMIKRNFLNHLILDALTNLHIYCVHIYAPPYYIRSICVRYFTH